ncbi:unnamed protein product, partial [Amoebophrya sp. A25]
ASGFLGSQVGKQLSSTGRSILESCRTIVTWAVELLKLALVTAQFGWPEVRHK